MSFGPLAEPSSHFSLRHTLRNTHAHSLTHEFRVTTTTANDATKRMDQQISTVEDLKLLTKDDLRDMGFSVGAGNRLYKWVKQHQKPDDGGADNAGGAA